MASSTAFQLGKSSWPSQILLVYRLGKASTTPETQTLSAPNHTPFGSRYTVEHAYQRIASQKKCMDLALGKWICMVQKKCMDLALGKWICMVLEWTLSKRLGLAYSKIDLSLLQCQSASQEKHGSMGDSTFYISEESLRDSCRITEHQGTGDFC